MDPLVAPHLEMLDDLRAQVVATVSPLDDDQVNRRVPGLQNSIGILVRHMAGSERYWVGEVVGNVAAVRDRDAEFSTDRVGKARVLADLQEAGGLSREVLNHLQATELLAEVDVRRTRGIVRETRGYALLHAVQHLAYHLGQIRYLVRLLQAGV